MIRNKLIQIIIEEILIIFALFFGLYHSVKVDTILPLILNCLMSLIYVYSQFKEYVYLNKLYWCKLIGICVQLGLNTTISQYCIILIHLVQTRELKYFILLSVILINAVQEQEFNYLSEVPFNLLYYLNIIVLVSYHYFYWKEMKAKQLADLGESQTIKLRNQEPKRQTYSDKISNRDLISNQHQSVSQQEIIQKMEANDDIVIQNLPWLQNQSTLVYKNQNIIYQNLYLGKLLKQSNLEDLQTQQQSKPDYEDLFLESQILIGSKELIEIGSGNADQSINSDGSFLLNGVTDYHKCKMKAYVTIRNLQSLMQSDYEKWRFSIVTLFRLKSEIFDFENILVKVFPQKIQDSIFIICLFEQQVPQKKKEDPTLPIINVFSTFVHESVSYINCILTLILLTQHEHENIQNTHKITYKQYYYMPIRMMSLRYILFINSMRDYIFYIQNQLFLRISAFKVNDLIEELMSIYEDNLKIREVGLATSIDLSENNQIIFTDFDRLKQILSCLLTYCLKYTTTAQLKLDIKSYTLSGIMISLKDSMIAKDEGLRKTITNLIRQLNQSLKIQPTYEVDLNSPLELQICALLCWQLSGTFKRGLEFLYDSQGYGTFSFVIESQTNQQRMLSSRQDTGPIKILGQKRYYETSLSLLLAQDSSQYREESKYISLTQLSKQFSMKLGDPFDVQSAYFSQISKIKQDSSNSKPLNSGSAPKQSKDQSNSFSGTWKQGFPDTVQQAFKRSKNGRSDSAHDSAKTHSNLDFGQETSNPSIHPPELTPKLLSSVIKYRLRLTCCAKVLIVDNDHYSVFSLSKVLEKYNIKSDKAFNGLEAQKLIEFKQQKPCHCGNKAYLLFFIEYQLPFVRGIELVMMLKDKMKNGVIDKGYSIIMATFVDLNSKVECFKNGVDYFIAKPFDIIDIGAAVQYLDF